MPGVRLAGGANHLVFVKTAQKKKWRGKEGNRTDKREGRCPTVIRAANDEPSHQVVLEITVVKVGGEPFEPN